MDEKNEYVGTTLPQLIAQLSIVSKHMNETVEELVDALVTTAEYKNQALDEYSNGPKRRSLAIDLNELYSCIATLHKGMVIINEIIDCWMESRDLLQGDYDHTEEIINEIHVNAVCAHHYLLRAYNSSPAREEFIDDLFKDLKFMNRHIRSFFF